jgi:monoterpene epsilon-lactone hydrolase
MLCATAADIWAGAGASYASQRAASASAATTGSMSADGGSPGPKDNQGGDVSSYFNTDRPVEVLREELEERAKSRTLQPGTVFEEQLANGVPCEWVLTPPADGVEPLPDNQVYFHCHGGGYYRGSTRVAGPICSSVCAFAGFTKCLSVNYRTAPEHPFPAALDDTYAAYSWLISADGGGVRPSDVICGGDSAGGGLIMGLLLKLRDEAPECLPAGAVPFSPWTDLTQTGDTFVTNADTGVPNCDKDYL